MSESIKFGDIVETNFHYGEKQLDVREFGKSPVKYEGNPAVYHTGDTVNCPYGPDEISSIQALGIAWSLQGSGVGPG